MTRYEPVRKLRDNSPARFNETENYYTNEYEINRIGGSDENYHLNGGNLMVRLGEHKYPTLKVKYLVDASNNNTPVFWINGVKQKTLTLVRGNIYDFEYEGDFTNNGANAQNRFRISEIADGTHGTDANGDPGTVYQTDITQQRGKRVTHQGDCHNTEYAILFLRRCSGDWRHHQCRE